VIKQAKQLKCDVNSKQFRDVLRHVWMPRLLEQVQPASQFPDTNNPNGSNILLQQNTLQSSVSGSSGISSDSSSVEFQVASNSDQNDSLVLLGHDGSKVWSSLNNQVSEQGKSGACDGDSLEGLWNDENMWFLQQLYEDVEIKYNLLA